MTDENLSGSDPLEQIITDWTNWVLIHDGQWESRHLAATCEAISAVYNKAIGYSIVKRAEAEEKLQRIGEILVSDLRFRAYFVATQMEKHPGKFYDADGEDMCDPYTLKET